MELPGFFLNFYNRTKTCVVNEFVGLWGRALKYGCVLSQPPTQGIYLYLFKFFEVCCQVGVSTVSMCMCGVKEPKMFNRFLLYILNNVTQDQHVSFHRDNVCFLVEQQKLNRIIQENFDTEQIYCIGTLKLPCGKFNWL